MSAIAKQDAAAQESFLSSLFQGGFYKPTQGRLVRQLVFLSLLLLGVLLAYEVSSFDWVRRKLGFYGSVGLAGGLSALVAWVSFRLVNYSRMADFLISVEAELNKVSWPGRAQLWKATGVVIFVIFALSALLFVFDFVWTFLFQNVFGIRA